MSPIVKIFGCRPPPDVLQAPAAGVRKTSKGRNRERWGRACAACPDYGALGAAGGFKISAFRPPSASNSRTASCKPVSEQTA